MSYIKIGDEQRNMEDASEQWISEQLRRRRAGGASACIQVFLKTSTIDMVLSTPECGGGGGGGGGRPATSQENQIFEEWAKRGLNERSYSPGNLISFLQQLRRNGVA